MHIDFFDVAAGTAKTATASLLRDGLSTAVFPRTFQLPFAEPRVSDQWLSSIEKGQLRDATSRLLTSCAVSPKWTAGQVANTLHHAASILLSLNAVPDANRCMQESLASLATAREAIAPEFDVQRWITLSNISLARQDRETCELWSRQASRTLTGHSGDLHHQALNHYLGDLLAIQACLRFDQESTETAMTILVEAQRAHVTAGSHLSVALDLLLQSRCHGLHSRPSAIRLLNLAEDAIAAEDPTKHNAATRNALLAAIQYDRQSVESFAIAGPVPGWN